MTAERFDRAYANDIVLEPVTSSSKWLAKKKNLENVHKALVRYIGRSCGTFPPIALKEPVDFNAVAEQNDVDQTMKVADYNSIILEVALTNIAFQLLGIFLMAAISSPDAEEYISEIQMLDNSVAGQIAMVIQAVCQYISRLHNSTNAGHR